jgi:hypothetical protein
VFKVDGKTGIITDLHDFDLYGQQGDIVSAGLALGTDGNFYGVAADGGAFPYPGVLFQITSDGTYTVFLTIPDHQEDWPLFSLRQHTNGKFYSVSRDGGGTTYYGTVYSFDNNLGAFVTFVRSQGHVGAVAQILGQGLTGTTSVTFNGLPAASFSVVSDTYMTAVVPTGATTGPVVVTTPSGPLNSNVSFRISQ